MLDHNNKINYGIDFHTDIDTHPSLSEEERDNLFCKPKKKENDQKGIENRVEKLSKINRENGIY